MLGFLSMTVNTPGDGGTLSLSPPLSPLLSRSGATTTPGGDDLELSPSCGSLTVGGTGAAILVDV